MERACIVVRRRGKRGCVYDFLVEAPSVGIRRFDTRRLTKRDAEKFGGIFAQEMEGKYGYRPSVRFE